MSQSYYPDEGSASAGEGTSKQSPPPDELPQASSRPEYMTVGTGSTSTSAHALMAQLDQDSGYGGSIADSGNPDNMSSWRNAYMEDRPTPIHTPTLPGQSNAAC